MAPIDIALLIVIALAAVWGFTKGFISQLGSLAAIVVGIIACRMLGPRAVGLIMPGGAEADSAFTYYAAVAMAYSVIYIVAYYAVLLVARMLRLAVHAVFLGPLDRIGGALFNIAKCLIMVSFLLNIYMVIFPSSRLCESSKIADGRLVTFVTGLGPKIVGAVTADKHNYGSSQQQ